MGLKAPTLKALKQKELGINDLLKVSKETGFPVAYFLDELDEIEGNIVNYHRFLMDDNNLARYCVWEALYPVKMVIGNMFMDIRKHSSEKIYVDVDGLIAKMPLSIEYKGATRDAGNTDYAKCLKVRILFKRFLEDKSIPDFGRVNLPKQTYIREGHQKTMVGLQRSYCSLVIDGKA